ncbi:MAG: Maf family protein [Bacillota bacterium]
MGKIILASASPRRKEILQKFNIDFDIRASVINEIINSGEEPKQIVMSLAFQKALDVALSTASNDIVIAADTVVVKDEVFGKPKDFEDAFGMLKRLQGSYHDVITGLAVVQANTNCKHVTFEKTKVKIKQLTDEQIKRYIDTGEVWDKAGAYAIQGKGSALVESIESDYFNVVGLPICKLENILRRYFDIYLF